MRTKKAVVIGAVAVLSLVALAACGHMAMMMMGRDVAVPPASEFGLGPRASANGAYTATLRPVEPLRKRKLQRVEVVVTDAAGQPVDGARIAVDGGMPQHGHGLPTQPRVTRNTGAGTYLVEGVKFNMGGWWEFELAIDGRAGVDSVTFNLDL